MSAPRRLWPNIGLAVLLASFFSCVAFARVNNPPVAVATAGAGTNTVGGVSSVKRLTDPSGTPVVHTLAGGGSHDPDGDPFTYHWGCDNRLVLVGVPTDQRDLTVLLPPGTYQFTLKVTDTHGASSSDSAKVEVIVDNVPPQAIAPEDLTVSATEAGGARVQNSAKLQKFLFTDPYAQDPLHLQFFFTALPPQINGVDVDANTLFPVYTTMTVTFRFTDSFGNIGAATSDVFVIDIQEGDLFVGTNGSDPSAIAFYGPNLGFVGVVLQVRGNSVLREWCRADMGIPRSVVVDSTGRVYFLAQFPSDLRFTGPPEPALFRCDTAGSAPVRLGVFRGLEPNPNAPPNYYVPLNNLYSSLRSLHLVPSVRIEINDGGVNEVTVTKEDLLGLSGGVEDTLPLGTGSRTESYRYFPSANRWEIGPRVPPPSSGGAPNMYYHKGVTYSVGGLFGVYREPLTIDLSGSVGGTPFGARLQVGGGYTEWGGHPFFLDNLNIPNSPSGCPPFPPYRNDFPSSGHLFAGMLSVIFDNSSQNLGLVFQAGGHIAAGSRYLTNVVEALWDADPQNDIGSYYQFALAAFYGQGMNCAPVPVIQHSSLHTFTTSPDASGGWTVAPSGLIGTRWQSGDVFRINQGDATPLLSGLIGPNGIAAWPLAPERGSGATVIIRIDSPVGVLVTDANGKRLGVDSGGNAVNDFGNDGFDSGPGSHPRFYAINNPAPGPYQVQSVGTGTGPFTVHMYSADLSKPFGEHISVTGNASPGVTGKHDFALDANGGLAFANTVPIAAAGADQTVTAVGTSATVTLDSSASSDPDGDALTFTWAGPFGLANGATPQVSLPVGVHVLNLTVEDGKGGAAEDTVMITVSAPADTTPPVLSLPANFSVTAASSAGAVVTYTASALDAVDGSVAVACAPASGSTFPVGATVVLCSATDFSGNTSNGSFTVTVNPPAPAANLPPPVLKIVSRGIHSGQTRFYDLEISNPNPTALLNLSLFRVTLTTLKGTGIATYNTQLSPPLPIALGDLAGGSSLRIRLYVDVPAGVLLFRISEGGHYYDASGKLHDFSGIHYDD